MLHILKCGKELLMEERDGRLCLPGTQPEFATAEAGALEFHIQEDETSYRAVSISLPENVPAPHILIGLREAYPCMAPEDYRAAAKASELMHWDRQSRRCGVCGKPLVRDTEISKKCPSCGNEVFAQVSPAIIVLVRRGNAALLVHARNFRRHFFGLVAGFVETGESLEDCVHREVMEETSLKVKNIRYRRSQAWPFPNSLMMGFTADYESGELRFADGELTEGGFFTADNLPQLPAAPSIARSLIDEWIAGQD